MPYRYVEHTADAAFEAIGNSAEEVFSASADAILGLLMEDPSRLRARTHREFMLEAETEEALLHRFLEELVFLKDARGLLLRVERLAIFRRGPAWKLNVRLTGEPADPSRHALMADVKAVTWHGFRLVRDGSQWRAWVLLDL